MNVTGVGFGDLIIRMVDFMVRRVIIRRAIIRVKIFWIGRLIFNKIREVHFRKNTYD